MLPAFNHLPRLNRALRIILLCSVLSCCSTVDASTHWGLFTSKQYSEYLQHIDAEVGGKTEQWLQLNLSKIMAIAISLDKTKQWDTDLFTKTQQHLSSSVDALRYFNATKKLLQGDVGAVELYFAGEPPHYLVWKKQIEDLQRHGYSAASNAFTVIYMTGNIGITGSQDDRVVQEGIKAWLDLPKAKRGDLSLILQTHLKSNWARRRQIAQIALEMLKGEPNDLLSNDYWNLVEVVDTSWDTASLSNAKMLADAGKKSVAILFAQKASGTDKDDIDLQLAIGKFLEQYAEPYQIHSFYQQALLSTSHPEIRELRMQYLRWLQKLNQEQPSPEITTKYGSVIKVDKLLVQKKLTEAQNGYTNILAEANVSRSEKIDAIAGLIIADPKHAVTEIEKLFNEPVPSRQLVWLGWQLWQKIESTFGEITRSSQSNNLPNATDKAPHWLPQATNVIEKILALAPVESLRGDPRTGNRSLRVPAAVLFALTGQTEKADKVLNQSITFQVPAPKGGWRNPPGTPTPPDANEARTFTEPQGSKVKQWKGSADVLVKRYQRTMGSTSH